MPKKVEPNSQTAVTYPPSDLGSARPREATVVLRRLTSLTYVGLLAVACDNRPINPVLLSTGGSDGLGGAPVATGGGNGTGGAPVTKGGAATTATGGATTTKGGATTATTSSTSNTGGAGTGTGGSTFKLTGECPLIPTEDTGWIDPTKNDCGIVGSWYSYNDCNKSPDDCTDNQVPADGALFKNTGGKMCTSGTTAAINKEYELKWGAGIALDLNKPVGATQKLSIGSLPRALLGFKFKISGDTVPEDLRVIYPTEATLDKWHFWTIDKAGDYTVLFTDVAQADWVGAAKAELNPADVLAIQFQVIAKDAYTVPFNFCVENLTALY